MMILLRIRVMIPIVVVRDVANIVVVLDVDLTRHDTDDAVRNNGADAAVVVVLIKLPPVLANTMFRTFEIS
jgi:hypothetical protein